MYVSAMYAEAENMRNELFNLINISYETTVYRSLLCRYKRELN